MQQPSKPADQQPSLMHSQSQPALAPSPYSSQLQQTPAQAPYVASSSSVLANQPTVAQTVTPVLPAGWQESKDQYGRVFYIDHITKTTHWQLPAQISTPGIPASPPLVQPALPGAPPSVPLPSRNQSFQVQPQPPNPSGPLYPSIANVPRTQSFPSCSPAQQPAKFVFTSAFLTF